MAKIHTLLKYIGVLVGVLLLPAPATGQVATASLTGQVADQTHAMIPLAKVTAVNNDTNVRTVGVTNEVGAYVLRLLPPGVYRIEVEKTGFRTVVRPDVILHLQDAIELNFEMTLGSASEAVTVEGGALLVNAQSGSVGTVVDWQFVANIPLNGRSFQSLLTLTPGVVLTPATETVPGQFSVNGQRAGSNYFMVDGVSANIGITADTVTGTAGGSTPGLSAFGGTNNLVSAEALQEFKILTSSYDAELGRSPGGQVSIVTRSGTNTLHGTAFEYFRHDALDANNWFATSASKPLERQHDFGGVFGGPIVKNRAFFFVSYEGLRLRQPQTGSSQVPSLASRQSAPPSIRPYLDAFPLPTGADTSNGLAVLTASFSTPSSLDATSVRLDHVVAPSVTVSGRFNNAPSATTTRGAFGGSLSDISPLLMTTRTATAGVNAVGARLSNEVRVNWSENRGSRHDELDDFGGAVPLTPAQFLPASVSPTDSHFAVNLSGPFVQTGFGVNNRQRQFNVIDSLSVIAGTHRLKLGIDYRRLSPDYVPLTYNGSATFAGATGANTAHVSGGIILAIAGPRFISLNFLSLYAQDTWQPLARLTLSYGLRWEIDGYPSERNNNYPVAVEGLDNPATLRFAPPGTPLWKTTYGNLAPRVGAAYQLSNRPGRETVLRGGAGVFHDLPYGFALQAFASSWPSAVFAPIPAGTAFPLNASAAAPPSLNPPPPAGALYVTDPNLQLPLTYQWNLSAEQSIGSRQAVSASYVGALGRRLLRSEQLQNPNPSFTTLFETTNHATSDYQGLQVQFRRRFSRGLQTLVSYSWSHSTDDVSNDFVSTAPIARIDPRQDWGPSDFDVHHVFSALVSYDLPSSTSDGLAGTLSRGWGIDSVFTARSAAPLNVSTTTDVLGLGIPSVSRPDLVPGVPLYINDSTAPGGERINRAAFAIAPAGSGRQGTLARNALRGFPAWQEDIAIRRRIEVTGRVRAELRAELFNVFNHPNFANPQGNLGTNAIPNPFFGRATQMLASSLGSGGIGGGLNPLYQMGGPRSVQLALKIHF